MTDIYVAGTSDSQNTGQESKEVTGVKTEGEKRSQPEENVRQWVTNMLDRTGETPGRFVGGAYNVRPDSRFINEQDDEEVVLMLRSHPITNLGWIVVGILVLLVMEFLLGTGIASALPTRYVFIGRLMVYLIALGYAFQKFLDWYYSVMIVTNERIINVDFINLLYRVVTYATLNHIEEPSMVAGGFVRSFFRYGDIFIETAAETPSIQAVAIPYPDRVIKIISELSEELEKRRELGQ